MSDTEFTSRKKRKRVDPDNDVCITIITSNLKTLFLSFG